MGEKNLYYKGDSTGTDCPDRLWSLLPWGRSNPTLVQSSATCFCFSRGIGQDRVVSSGPFQPQPLHDSVIVTGTQRVLLLWTEQDKGVLMLIVNVRTQKAAQSL